MKVKNIEESLKADGSSYWVVTLAKKDGTPSKVPFPEWTTKPTYNIGDELPFEVDLVKPPYPEKWYFERRGTGDGASSTETPKSGGTKTWGKPAWKPNKNEDEIRLAVAVKGAIKLEMHHYVPEGKTDEARILRSALKLYEGMKEIIAKEK